ncbi:PGAP1-like alpha/beta domain-containing protein [Cellulosimicrobium funkei]|uniref:PGAP1-like alpha/beta domain-containing protein n=1 Tax=Cellulosimicrobium funkei TaxID=264251 RepID=UPI003758439F
MIRGGTEPTVVETAGVVAQAAVLAARADLLAGAAGALRDARHAVELTTATPTAFAGRLVPAEPLGAAAGANLTTTPFWSAEVRGGGRAPPPPPPPPLLDDLDAAALLTGQEELRLRGLAERLHQAVRVYDDADAAAAAGWSDTALVVAGRHYGLAGAGAAGLGMIVAQGLAGLAQSLLHGGPALGRLVTTGEALHPATVRALGRTIGMLDPDRPWYAVPTVGNAAAVLRASVQPLHDRFLPDPEVRRVDAAPYDLPTPTDTRSALGAVAALGSTDSVLSVQRIVKDGGTPTWVVAIPGTQPGNLRTVWNMTSNYDLMSDDESQRARADSVRAVLDAMDQSGIEPEDDVVLVGHSQGGMVAATIAAATVGTYQVRHVVTAGSPVGGHGLPPGVRATHLETSGEGVSGLDGKPNPATPERVTVTGTVSAPGGGPPLDVPHSVGYHQDVLDAAVEVGDRGLEEHLADVEHWLDGEAEDPLVYEARLVPDPETTFCVGELAVPRPPWPPWPAPDGVVTAPGPSLGTLGGTGTFGGAGTGGGEDDAR